MLAGELEAAGNRATGTSHYWQLRGDLSVELLSFPRLRLPSRGFPLQKPSSRPARETAAPPSLFHIARHLGLPSSSSRHLNDFDDGNALQSSTSTRLRGGRRHPRPPARPAPTPDSTLPPHLHRRLPHLRPRRLAHVRYFPSNFLARSLTPSLLSLAEISDQYLTILTPSVRPLLWKPRWGS